MNLLRVFIPFALGYFLSYLFRVVNAVIASDLVRELGLDAADLGLLTSAYFLAFAAFQLPLGILLDRFGPRRTEAALLIFAALGAFVFAGATSASGLIVGRALIGFGVSACLMAAFKAYVMWVPAKRLPLINGLQMAAGGLGALAGTVPVEMALTIIGWRGIFSVLGVAAAAVSVLILVTVPKRGDHHPKENLKGQLRGVAAIFTNPFFWRVAPLTVATQSSFLAIQSLWSGPWLRDVAGLSREGVADHLFMIAAAMVSGFILMGGLTERLGRLGVKPLAVAVSAMILFIASQAALAMQWTEWTLVLWMLFGFFGTAGILPYAVLSQSFPRQLAGRVITGLNLMVFATAFMAQWAIGAVIDLWPAPDTGYGAGYAPQGYQAGFGMMLAFQAAALVWFGFFRRKP